MVRRYHGSCFDEQKYHSKKQDKNNSKNGNRVQQKSPQIAYGKVTVPGHIQ